MLNFRFLIPLVFVFAQSNLYGSTDPRSPFSLVFELPVEFMSQQIATIADRSYHTIRNVEFDTHTYREGVGDIAIQEEIYRHVPIYGPPEYPDVNGHIYKNTTKRQIIIALHGSYWIDDWIQDFKFGMISSMDYLGHEGNVHKGFLNMSRRIFPNLKETLQRLLSEDERKAETFEYVFTGHSLGGALSIISAAFLARDLLGYNPLHNQVKIITFSTPPVGDSLFNEEFHKRIAQDNILNFLCTSDLLGRGLYSSRNFMIRKSIGIVGSVIDKVTSIFSPVVETTLSDGYDQTGIVIDVRAPDHTVSKFKKGLEYLWNARRLEANIDVIRRIDEATGGTFSKAAAAAFVGWTVDTIEAFLATIGTRGLASESICVEEAAVGAGIGASTAVVSVALMKYFALMHELPTIESIRDAFLRTYTAYSNPDREARLLLRDVGRSNLVDL